MPSVSVLLPFVNENTRLEHATASILNQSFTDFELILINNGSDDATIAVASGLKINDQRIVLLHENEQGIAFALNKGLRYARGKYIARMDADDISLATRLEKQVAFLEKHPSIDVVATQTHFKSEILAADGFKIFTEWQNSICSPAEHALFRFIESPIAHPTVMFRKNLIDQYGYYSTEKLPEDYELWLRWMEQDVQFQKIAEPLLVWNDHAARLSRCSENYSKAAFFETKMGFLARWVKKNVATERSIIICGSSKTVRMRAAILQEHGICIHGFTDVKKRPNRSIPFVPLHEIQKPDQVFLINFISKRGVGEAIRNHFTALGFCEGIDFILAA